MSHFSARHSTADNGDGTYRNPVLRADWSDPDAIRVGDDYYLIASSFHRVPGLPILHSRDLVNWTIIGHALTRLTPEADFSTPQRGGGVWAPALRHHNGRYWIIYPDPDRGLFTTSAADPAGEWTTPHLLKRGSGLIDPCPLWASDGSAYLVHGWAKSRAGINNRLTVHRMNDDATRLLDSDPGNDQDAPGNDYSAPGNDHGTVVIDGDALPGYRTLEGPKFYERDGWYWIFAPAGGVTDGWQTAFRSRDPFGPYEERIVLEQGDTTVNGPHQGAWVTTQDGSDWFLHFQDKGAFGRVVHLQPMHWDHDGWPVIGDNGRPVTVHPKPLQGQTPTAPATSDDFTAGIGPQWAWQANPEPDWAATGPGLTLTCAPTADPDLRHLPNLLGQRLPDGGCRAETTMRLDAEPGATAGLAVVGDDYAWIGLTRDTDRTALTCRTAHDGAPPRDNGTPRPLDDTATAVTVGVHIDAVGRCQFYARHPGAAPEPLGEPFQATAGRWVGAALGLFATGHGTANFDAVRITAAETHA